MDRAAPALPGLILAALAGAAAAAPGTSVQTRTAEPDAYIYHIISTGERIVSKRIPTPVELRGAAWAWSSDVIDPCVPDGYDPDNGLTTAVFPAVHDENLGVTRDPGAVAYLHDWLEHPGDSIVATITIPTFAQIVDADSDGNGVGDGVAGLDCILVFTENDAPDNRANAVAHSPIVLESLPGSLDNGAPDGIAGDGEISFEEGQIIFNVLDFSAGNAPTDIEIGDTNGVSDGLYGEDSQFSGVPGVDTDGDGLINTGFILGYRQPGVSEGDGLIARFPELAGAAGLANPQGPNPDLATFPNIRPVGFPLGAPSDNPASYDNRAPGDTDWPYNPSYTPLPGEGVGGVDGFALIDAQGTDLGIPFADQFSCDPNAMTPPFWQSPWYTVSVRFASTTPPANCNDADVAEPFFLLDLNDIAGFIAAYQARDGIADIAEPSGVFDLADISAFITAFLAGCP